MRFPPPPLQLPVQVQASNGEIESNLSLFIAFDEISFEISSFAFFIISKSFCLMQIFLLLLLLICILSNI